jgi:hypothetical protein
MSQIVVRRHREVAAERFSISFVEQDQTAHLEHLRSEASVRKRLKELGKSESDADELIRIARAAK